MMRNEVYMGRDKIVTSLDPIDENILKIIEQIEPIFDKNRGEISYLYDYYRGRQDILDKVKTIRPEINNKVVENRAYEIVEFKTGYMFGEPLQYVQRGKNEEIIETEPISKLNQLMYYNNKSGQDRELGEWLHICGQGYRIVLPENDPNIPFTMNVLDPRKSFVVYDNSYMDKPLLGGLRIDIEDGYQYSIYTDNKYYLIEYSKDKDGVIIETRPHSIGYIPIIEYVANPSRMGAFEPVIPLLNTINKMGSNRMDGVEQFVQSLMKFINADIEDEDIKKISQLGAVKIFSKNNQPADVEIMTQELKQDQAQTYVDYLYQTVLTITGMPDRQSSAGGNTGQALTIGQGWVTAESRANAMEQLFRNSENRFLKIVLRILKDSELSEYFDDLTIFNVDVKFNRRQTDNLLVKTQGLQNLLTAGVHPRLALAQVGLFADPEQTYIDSKEFLEKWKIEKGDELRNQIPNPDESGNPKIDFTQTSGQRGNNQPLK